MDLVEMIAKDKQETGVQVFSFGNNPVRVVRGGDGEPWFVAKDVADVLGYTNPRKAVGDHCKSAVSGGVTIRDAIGRDQPMTIIPERDVYRLVMRSKLPAAERFEEWVVGEVLPSIRKTGRYDVADARSIAENLDTATVCRWYLTLDEKHKQLQAHVAEIEPAANAWMEACSAGEDMLLSDVGKLFSRMGSGPRKIFKILSDRKIIFRKDDSWRAYESYVQRGYFRMKRVNFELSDGTRTRLQTLVTPRGLDYIARLMLSSGRSDVCQV